MAADFDKQGHSSMQPENDHSNCNQKEKKDVLLDHMEINITECEKRETGALNYRDFFTVYLIETKVVDKDWTGALSRLSTIWRRYSEFEALRHFLVATYPYLVVAPLPEKKFDTVDRGGEKRRGGLETFLLRCASHPVLSRDQQLMAFLQQEEGWRESLPEAGYLEQAESKLKALSVRLKRPDKRFEAHRNYAAELQLNLANLLRVRGKLAERTFSTHKLHANYGRVMSEWSRSEKLMGDTLQKAGHYLDSLAANIDVPLEEEELIVDQLKEYLFFADSLTHVCRAQEGVQAALERAQGQVEACQAQREGVYKGRSGLVSRLFGSVDTDEVRELKCGVLDQRIEETNAEVNTAQANLEEFSALAVEDIERFQSQKVIDLRETLTNYVQLQAKMCRKDLQTWTHIRDCFAAIP